MITIADQLAHEESIRTAGIERFLRNIDNARSDADGKPRFMESNTTYGQSIITEYVMPFADALEADIKSRLGKPGRVNPALRLLENLSLPMVAFITTKVLVDGITRARLFQTLAYEVGHKVEDQVRMERFQNAAGPYYKKVLDSQRKAGTTSYRHIKNALAASDRKVKELEPWLTWADNAVFNLGGYCIRVFAEATGLVTWDRDARGGELIIPTDAAAELIKRNVETMADLTPEWLPCIVPPREWTAPNRGGYYTAPLYRRLPMVKTYTRDHWEMLSKANMPRVYRALNGLQATPWEVNKGVFDALSWAWAEGVKVKGLPEKEPLKVYPCPVDSSLIESFKEKFKAERARVKRLNKAEANRKGKKDTFDDDLFEGSHQPRPARELLTAAEYKAHLAFGRWKSYASKTHKAEVERQQDTKELQKLLRITERMGEYKKLYFVYRCDSRGRMYAVGTALNPQGSKLSKAVLDLHKRDALGKDGYFWLRVHAANVYGEDKLPFKGRVQWVEDNRDMIKAIAADHENTVDTWGKADEPFEFLKVCRELARLWSNVEEYGKEVYQTFKTNICPAMDGTCNGLQHYAMLLRDPESAKHVNVLPSDKPQDIYGVVADRTNEVMVSRLGGDDELDAKYSRQWLDFGLDRSGAKKPVMVLPYGGSQLGRIEALKDWAEDTPEKCAVFGAEYTTKGKDGKEKKAGGTTGACTWLGGVMSKQIARTVPAALKGMKFIQDISRLVAKGHEDGTENNAVVWTVPITGFPVHMQPFQQESRLIKSALLGSTRYRVSTPTEKVNLIKVRGASAPNFIHSLDAAHLMLTVGRCLDRGIDNFRVIHDSYGTTCGQTTAMHYAIRQAMLDLYTADPLWSFLEEQEEAHPWLSECLFGAKKHNVTPRKKLASLYGDLDLREVLKSLYLFS